MPKDIRDNNSKIEISITQDIFSFKIFIETIKSSNKLSELHKNNFKLIGLNCLDQFPPLKTKIAMSMKTDFQPIALCATACSFSTPCGIQFLLII